jgi:HPt (histidine-containing phosphotransfer) domain-containing protein
MSETGEGWLDVERLHEVAMHDAEFERALLEAYIEDAHAQMTAMQDALDTGSAATLSAAAHSLKGASGNIGVVDAQHICMALERINPQDDPEGAALLLTQLCAVVEKVAAFAANR